jgi:hypothetical protein
VKLSSIIGIVAVICIAAYVFNACAPVWQFDHLEGNARKAVTGPELQSWAASIIAQHPTNDWLRMSQLGTNFLQRLRGLAPKLGPHVVFYEADGTNSPAWVMIGWGSGFLGHRGFEIGPTNCVSRRPGHAWRPGVYFWSDNGH